MNFCRFLRLWTAHHYVQKAHGITASIFVFSRNGLKLSRFQEYYEKQKRFLIMYLSLLYISVFTLFSFIINCLFSNCKDTHYLWNSKKIISSLRIAVVQSSEAGYHIQRQVKIVTVSLDVAGMEDIGLCQMGGVFLNAFRQRDGIKACRGFHLDG